MKSLGKIIYMDRFPDTPANFWVICDIETYYLGFILDENKRLFSEYITPSGKIVDCPPLRQPISIFNLCYKHYTPKSIYNIYCMGIYNDERFR